MKITKNISTTIRKIADSISHSYLAGAKPKICKTTPAIAKLEMNVFLRSLAFATMSTAISFGSFAFADSEMLVSIDNKNYRPLGAGFDSNKLEFRADCVESSAPQKMLLSAGQINLKMEATQESLANKLGISAGGRYRSGATTTTASAEFLNQAQSNNFSISYNYVAESLYREYIENSNNSPIQTRPNIQDYTRDQRTFFANCGDEYVYARDLAARLFVNMKISFVSKQERNRFAASFGVDSPAFSMQANLENESAKYSSSNQISISAMQVGGDPSKMGKIICPKKINGEIDEECAKSSRLVVNCSFGDIKPCMEVIANVIAYANAQDGDNFPKQITGGQNYSVTKLFTRPFVYIGSQFPPRPQKTTEDNFQVEVEQLNGLFDEDYKNWVYANQLWKGKAPRLSPREKTAMELMQDAFYRNLLRESMAIENCYGQGYTTCTTELSATKTFVGFGSQSRKTIADIESLTSPEIFVQYCDLASSDNPDIASTVKSLQQYLVKNNLIDATELKRGDVCFNLDQKLSAIKTLDLSGSDYIVGDLRPIAVLTALQNLNLSNRGLVDITQIANLKLLVSLTLDGNLIRDISPITSLENLKTLSVKNNRIVDLSSLSRSPQLERIEARGNSKQLTCPLAYSYQCKLLDFSDAINLALNTNNCDLRVNHAATQYVDNNGEDAILVSGGDSSNGFSVAKNTIEIRTRDNCTLSAKKLSLPRSGHTMTRLPDGRIVVIGGLSDSIEILNKNLVSHMVKDKMQSYRSRHTATLLNDGRILIVGGYTDQLWGSVRSNNISASVEIFNPQDESITVVDRNIAPRAEHTATKLNDGSVLLVGGYAGERMVNLVEVFDPDRNRLHELDDVLSQGRMGHSASLMNDGKVLIAGGYQWQKISTSGVVNKTLSAMNSIEIFDPQTETFSLIEDQLSSARGELLSFPMYDGRVLLIGGENKGQIFLGFDFPQISALSDIEVFDPLTMGIYQVGHMSLARAYFVAAPVGKKSILVSGGTGSQASAMSSELIIYRSVK